MQQDMQRLPEHMIEISHQRRHQGKAATQLLAAGSARGLSAWLSACVLAVVGVSAMLLAATDHAAAQAPPKAQPGARTKAAPADSAAAQSANDQAQKLLLAGNAQGATNVLSSAISGGKLPPPVMARALYLRGVAHRKLQKPAQAISDLTSALWLKGGLSTEDRADAIKQRSAAYAEAGLAEPGQNTVEAKPVPAPVQASAAASPAAEKPARAASKRNAVADASSPPSASAPRIAQATTQASVAQATTQAGVAQATIQAGVAPATDAKTEWAGRGGKRIEPPTPPPSESGFPAFPTSSAGSSQPSSGSGSLFGGLFGNSAPAEKPAEPKLEVAPPPAPVTAPAAQAPVQRAAAPARQKSAAAPVKAAAAVQAAPAPATPAAANADPVGAFHARVALVRTKAEADTILARVKGQYGQAIGSRSIAVDQSSFGNMGTFYQVKIVGYASVRDAQAACDKLKGSGLDCVPANR